MLHAKQLNSKLNKQYQIPPQVLINTARSSAMPHIIHAS